MKRIYFCNLIVFSLYLWAAEPVWAQMERTSRTLPPSAIKEAPVQELSLTEDQQNVIKRVKANYLAKVVQLRSELAANQLEFKSMIGDPNINEEAIRVKGREIEAVNGQIVREMINYEIEVRRILTAEQIRAWNRDTGAPVQKKWGKNP